GDATAADAQALNRWRQTSQAHRRAFAEANRLWEELRPATAVIASRSTTSDAAMAGVAHLHRPQRQLGRRVVLGGMAAAPAAATGYVVVRPPLELWPSVSEMTADYRTGIGQQKQIAFEDSASVSLNTKTSIAVLATDRDGTQASIELIAGEATIAATSKPFIVEAARGRTIATGARFNVRRDGEKVCVTCLEGVVRVEHLRAGREADALTVPARHQVTYAMQDLGAVTAADAEAVTAWQRGVLVFRNDP